MKNIIYKEIDIVKVAKGIAKNIKPGDVITFTGELAAGKTTLIRDIVRALGYDKTVNSPTFVIEHRYKLGKKIKEIIHLDLYRLNISDISKFDWDEYSDKSKVVMIEWPEIASGFLQTDVKTISIKKVDEKTRELTFSQNFSD